MITTSQASMICRLLQMDLPEDGNLVPWLGDTLVEIVIRLIECENALKGQAKTTEVAVETNSNCGLTMVKVIHRKSGQTLLLSQEQYNRFFDNRDPREWSVEN